MYRASLDPLATTMGRGHAPAGLRPTERVGGRYRVIEHLASGGLGDVFLARDERLDRDVALKLSHQAGEASLERFYREAAITARLEHPAIITVHDRGQLPDGRAWFTMRLVRGRTLGRVIADFHAGLPPAGWARSADGTTLRRLVDVLVRVAEAMAYAHGQGVVHCDLKPANIMVGSFGEVQVMDWGLATAFQTASDSLEILLDHNARRGGPAGTPMYMAPEQAAGIGLYGPVTDIWGLGGLLLEALAGAPPFDPRGGAPWPALQGVEPVPTVLQRAGARADALPTELVELCDRARAFDPSLRLTEARTFAEDLRAWLDGARRHARALARVAAADGRAARLATLRRKASRDRVRAAELAAELEPRSPVEAWRPVWALEDRAAVSRRVAEEEEAAWKQDLRAALNLDPTLEEARERLADHYVDRVRAAEAARRPVEAARAVSQLAVHARPRHMAFLTGRGHIELQVAGDAVEVELLRFFEVDRRLVARPMQRRTGPSLSWTVPHGSYLISARAPGRATVRLPVVVGRGETWRWQGPGESAPRVLTLPPADALDADDVLVGAGWCVVGGDPLAPDAPPHRRIWVDGFVMRRFPVTVGEWLGFLDDLDARGDAEALERCSPCAQPADAQAHSSLVRRLTDRSLALAADPAEHGRPRHQAHDLPINRVDWRAAVAYARWLAGRTGHRWRLPDEFEWEKAARGADGRLRPWGDHMLPQWAAVLDGFADHPGRRPVHAVDADVSPYGVRGLAGNVRTWCCNLWQPGGSTVVGDRLVVEPAADDDPALRAVRGSAWSATSSSARAAARFADAPERRYSSVGVRLVRPWPAG